MNHQEIKKSLEAITKIFEKIPEPEIRTAVGLLFNLVESLARENETNRKIIQSQKDAINRLKGEQGKPKIRPQKKNSDENHSSEEERKMREEKKKKGL